MCESVFGLTSDIVCKVNNILFGFFFLLGHLYLSGMWFGVAPITATKRTCLCFKEVRLRAQNMIIILKKLNQHN